ncbi:hypothetical protein SprV_0602175000 [Sparganum proliferum]
MGSPISGLIAETVLQRLESLVFRHHRPKSWARYVDDTFVVIERDQMLTFKEQLNTVFEDIQFTMEEEENNQLAFLDVLVCCKDGGGLKTKVTGSRVTIPASRTFYVCDTRSGRRFLVDTDAHLRVIPLTTADRRRPSPGLLLQAVNTPPNATFGTWSLSPNIRLRRLFPWVFVVSDVPCVILGADLDLLVDCRQLRQQDQTTKRNVPDVPSSDVTLTQIVYLDSFSSNILASRV